VTRWLALAFAVAFGEADELAELAELDALTLGPVGFAWSAGFAMDFNRTCPSA
jgi:hypothetical protein